MSRVCCILMCGGRQSRMGAYEAAKQLVPVLGEPCAERTVRLLRAEARQVLVRVVAPETPEWTEFARRARADLVSPPAPLFLEALRDVLPMPDFIDRYLILCGDVVFSPEILRSLIASPARVAFAGRFVPNIYTGRPAGELFGLSVAGSARQVFLDHVSRIIRQAADISEALAAVTQNPARLADIREKNGRLWQLLHVLEDAGVAEVIECAWTDYIDDIDGPDDLERLPAIERIIARRQGAEG